MEDTIKHRIPATGKITTGQAAKICEVSNQTIINWLNQGKIQYERIGRGPRKMNRADLDAYLANERKTFEAA